MGLSVSQVMSIIHRIAPPEFAESWDNVGLQIGSVDWEVRKVWVSLDPLLNIIESACYANVDLLVTHHPLFFDNLSRIDTNTKQGKIVELALKNKLAIFCAHTNLDSVFGGVNDVLSCKIGLIDIKPLENTYSNNFYKLVVFVPLGSEDIISDALFSSGAGQIGSYSCCSFKSRGLGTFLPSIEASPTIGKHNILSSVEELRIESIVDKKKLRNVIDSISMVHPYETLPYDIYPIIDNKNPGIGRIGSLKEPLPLYSLVNIIKSKLNLSTVKVSGDLDMIIKSVVVCSGSGSAFIKHFFNSGSQVYLSSEINYHNAREADDLGLSIIDIGHFSSEHLIVNNLSRRIKNNIQNISRDVIVSPVNTESDIFEYL